MSILPKEKIKATGTSPKRLVFYSQIKSGKTTALSLLEDHLMLDFEDGTDFVDAVKMKIIGILTPKTEDETVKTMRQSENKWYLQEVVAALKAEIKETGKYPYRYISIDTTTGLEEMVMPIANQMYRNTPMGAKWGLLANGQPDPNIKVTLSLPQGAGYGYLRDAFEAVIQMVEEVCERSILSGHVLDKIVETGGREVSTKDIDLTGKLKGIACKKADAVAYLYRKKNEVIMNFKTVETIICGNRAEHLRDKEIVVSEMIDGKVVGHWDRIYID